MVEKRWIERIIDKDNWGFGAASQACDNISLALCIPSLLIKKYILVGKREYGEYIVDMNNWIKDLSLV